MKNLITTLFAAVALLVSASFSQAQVTFSGQALGKKEIQEVGAIIQASVPVASSATPKFNLDRGSVFFVTLNANATFSFTGNRSPGRRILIKVKQDATGSRTVTWPAIVRWPGGTAPTLTTTASRADVFEFLDNGTQLLGSTVGLNYTE